MDVKDIRKDLHQLAELGRCEFKTKEYIINILKTLDCEIIEVLETGVVAYFDLGYQDSVCFRADMDGLPIIEKTNLKFKSLNKSVSHACGHDGHMAMLLKFAMWVNDNKEKLKKNIVCLFQPSEEERAGAMDIINSKILDKLNVKEIFGMHIWPGLEENKIFTMAGGMLASSSEVDIEVYGKTCHAANRNEGIDSLLIATSLINDCYDFSKVLKENHLISFGKLEAGVARNAVPGYAKIEGTFRAFNDETMELMLEKLQELAHKYDEKCHSKIVIRANDLYKSVINSKELIEKYQKLLDIKELKKPFMQAEDFGCYTRKYKAMFMLLGAGYGPMLHTENFDFNMDILETGVAAYIKIASSLK